MSRNTFNLSEIQKAYYMGKSKDFELGDKSTQVTYVFKTNLDIQKFEEALNKEILRQPMLRAVILNDHEQKVLDKVRYYKIKIRDYTGLSEQDAEQSVLSERNRAFNQVFQSDIWPLFEWVYVKTCHQNYLIASADLLIADGASLMTLVKEIMCIYDGKERDLVKIERTYEDYIKEKYLKKQEKRYKRAKEYWMEKIDEIPAAPLLPYKVKRNSVCVKTTINRATISVEEENWIKIKEISKRMGVSESVAVLCAYVIVLSHWSEEKNFTINMTITERKRYNMQNVLGDYTSSLLIPVNEHVAVGEMFWDNAKVLNHVFMDSYRYSIFEGVEVIKEIAKHRNMIDRAVMPIVFTSLLFEEDLYDEIYRLGELIDAISKTPQVIIDCQVEESRDKLFITWDYVEEYIDFEIVERMLSQMKRVLVEATDCMPINKNIFGLTETEIKMWDNYNKTDCNIPRKCLIEMFLESVQRYPDNMAVSDSKRQLTYKEMDELSDIQAGNLVKEGVGKGDFVGVLTYRCVETIINIIGALKIGAAYVPIDYTLGDERKQYILNQSGCRCLMRPELNESSGDKSYRKPDYSKLRDHCAYVIYTSGTTGFPKGVSISNTSVSNTIQDINSRININQKDKFLGLSSYGFDLSVYDIFGAFSAGAELVIIENEKDPRTISKILKEKKITIWNSVPALCELTLSYLCEKNIFPDLRRVLLSGDWISITLPKKLKRYFINAEIYSLGGATEASIWSIIYPIKEINSEWNNIPYGYPLANQKIYVLDQITKQLCPPNVVGEIYIGGLGVAIEYQNDEEKTRLSFINNEGLGRLYKTGDKGVFSYEGYVRILGRLDQQVKINGYRIETQEIVSCLLKIPDISQAVVLPIHKHTQLCGFIECEKVSKEEIISFLQEYLPSYMIPQKMIFLNKLPLTSNGKICYQELRKLGEAISEEEIVKPRNELESIVADVWKKALEIEKVGVTQSFFELGGDSIKAAWAYALLEEAGYEIEFSMLYKNNTIEKLAKKLKKKDIKMRNQEKIESGEL